MGELIFEKLNVNIDDREIIKDLSFKIETDKSLAIVGESGSGKTFISRLLVGQKPASARISGDITVDGKEILKLSQADWEEMRGSYIAYIEQNPMGLFNEMQTIGSHAIELFKSKLKLRKDEALERFEFALAKFNLKNGKELVRKYPFQLSGGMLQRVMVAMMMELEPKILIADEPTSALDTYNTQKVIEVLKVCKDRGTRLIVVTHDYSLVKALADEIVIMKQGDLIESGDAMDILKNPQSEYGRKLMQDRVYVRRKGINTRCI